jgi:hypothetical protein
MSPLENLGAATSLGHYAFVNRTPWEFARAIPLPHGGMSGEMRTATLLKQTLCLPCIMFDKHHLL